MINAAILVAGLGKKYIINHEGREKYATLRDTLASSVRNLGRRLFGSSADVGGGPTKEEVWALRDVSFEIGQGERLGIIGRNGAGKSTLLKILSRITDPTCGRVTIHGRVASLLEVGTGFHPELTGRENIYLNGAILGMSKEYVKKKFDEIVAFSEVEKFLDTPLKRYSSGMYVRLAFAVAAHLEPEILVVDEVLAVGDFAFQKKCLGKMEDIAHGGRTVLFVSHDMGAINTLCERAVLLHQGSLVMAGNTRDVVSRYLQAGERLYSPVHFSVRDNGEFRLTAVSVIQNGSAAGTVECRRPFTISIEYEMLRVVAGSRLVLVLRNQKGEVIFTTSDYDDPTPETFNRKVGRFVSIVTIPGKLLKEGDIYGTVAIDVRGDRVVFAAVDVLHVNVADPEADPLAELHQREGVVAPILPWKTTRLGDPQGEGISNLAMETAQRSDDRRPG